MGNIILHPENVLYLIAFIIIWYYVSKCVLKFLNALDAIVEMKTTLEELKNAIIELKLNNKTEEKNIK